MNPAWLVAVLTALAIPWTTWMLRFTMGPGDAMLNTPQEFLGFGSCLIVALWISSIDRWLGVFLLYLGVWGMFTSTPGALGVVLSATLGSTILVAASTMRERGRWWAEHLLAVSLAGQFTYVVWQLLKYDPLWAGWGRYEWVKILGTYGNSAMVGIFFAWAGVLVPWWIVPIAVGGVVISGSATAALALFVGLMHRLWVERRAPWFAVSISCCSLAAVLLVLERFTMRVGALRLRAWELAWEQIKNAPVLGYGLGAWLARIPEVQVGKIEVFHADVHNEYLQMLHDFGFVGVFILLIWVWNHRQAFGASRWGSAVISVLVTSIFWFPFHIPTLFPFAMLIGGGALSYDHLPERRVRCVRFWRWWSLVACPWLMWAGWWLSERPLRILWWRSEQRAQQSLRRM